MDTSSAPPTTSTVHRPVRHSAARKSGSARKACIIGETVEVAQLAEAVDIMRRDLDQVPDRPEDDDRRQEQAGQGQQIGQEAILHRPVCTALREAIRSTLACQLGLILTCSSSGAQFQNFSRPLAPPLTCLPASSRSSSDGERERLRCRSRRSGERCRAKGDENGVEPLRCYKGRRCLHLGHCLGAFADVGQVIHPLRLGVIAEPASRQREERSPAGVAPIDNYFAAQGVARPDRRGAPGAGRYDLFLSYFFSTALALAAASFKPASGSPPR